MCAEFPFNLYLLKKSVSIRITRTVNGSYSFLTIAYVGALNRK